MCALTRAHLFNYSNKLNFIQEQYWTPPDLKRLLSSKLKYMAANGKLLKVNTLFLGIPIL